MTLGGRYIVRVGDDERCDDIELTPMLIVLDDDARPTPGPAGEVELDVELLLPLPLPLLVVLRGG